MSTARCWASIQLRRGPNVSRPVGPAAAPCRWLKLVLKETIIPSSANASLFIIAPMITFIDALVAWAVVPFDDGWFIADINVGILYSVRHLARSAFYGVIIAGWASNSKYRLPPARCVRPAQMVVLRSLDRLRADHRAASCVGSLNLSEVGAGAVRLVLELALAAAAADVRDLLHLGAGRDATARRSTCR